MSGAQTIENQAALLISSLSVLRIDSKYSIRRSAKAIFPFPSQKPNKNKGCHWLSHHPLAFHCSVGRKYYTRQRTCTTSGVLKLHSRDSIWDDDASAIFRYLPECGPKRTVRTVSIFFFSPFSSRATQKFIARTSTLKVVVGAAAPDSDASRRKKKNDHERLTKRPVSVPGGNGSTK